MTINRETYEELLDKCVKAGIKMTDQRRVILQVLTSALDHPSVESVFDRAKSIDASISMATVYRTLNLLDELELVSRREFNQNFFTALRSMPRTTTIWLISKQGMLSSSRTRSWKN